MRFMDVRMAFVSVTGHLNLDAIRVAGAWMVRRLISRIESFATIFAKNRIRIVALAGAIATALIAHVFFARRCSKQVGSNDAGWNSNNGITKHHNER